MGKHQSKMANQYVHSIVISHKLLIKTTNGISDRLKKFKIQSENSTLQTAWPRAVCMVL